MSALLELADRVEKASGPDRELDARIRKGVVGDFGFCGDGDGAWYCSACCLPAHELTQEPGCGAPVGMNDERRSYPNDWREDERLPLYTASLDAAVLLATGNIGRLLRDALERAEEEYINPGSDVLARFLTAACLRANAALSDRKDRT